MTVDRIEENILVCFDENENECKIDSALNEIRPAEGDIILVKTASGRNPVITAILHSQTEEKKKQIGSLFDRLKNRNHE